MLKKLFLSTDPITVVIRITKCFYLMYRFYDVTSKCFGRTMISERGVGYQIGLWGAESDLEYSSNWREFDNSLEISEAEGVSGNL